MAEFSMRSKRLEIEMGKIGVDPACYDLARHFLTDQDTGDIMRTDAQIAEDLK